jgi:hypothetical protein
VIARSAFLGRSWTRRSRNGAEAVTKKRLLLIASLPLAIAVIIGVLAMLPPRTCVTKEIFDRIKVGMPIEEVEAIIRLPWEEEKSLDGENVLWFTDDNGSCIGVPVDKQRGIVSAGCIGAFHDSRFQRAMAWIGLR